MSTPEKDDVYFRDWYAKNGETLNKSRRQRYQTDPEYKAEVLKRNREARQRKREETSKERAQERKASRVRMGSRGWKTVEQPLSQENGTIVTATLFTIGALARTLGRSVQAVRLWEREGLLPETELRNKKGDRLYTAEMVETIRKVMNAKGKVQKTAARTRPTPKGVVREVQYNDGSKEPMHFFRVGVLAEAIQRTVVTVEILENKGYLPATPFRASGTKYRVYTLPMIEAVRKAFEARGGEIRGEQEWLAFKEDVRAAWESQKVFGATLVEPPEIENT